MLTADWVNGISAVVVALSVARAWLVTSPAVVIHKAERDRVMLFTEGYLLPSHTQQNRGEIERSVLCGCLCCEHTFPAREIRRWVESGQTAVCPRCGADAVVGSGAGFRITPELLRRAHRMRFDDSSCGHERQPAPGDECIRRGSADPGRGRLKVMPDPRLKATVAVTAFRHRG